MKVNKMKVNKLIDSCQIKNSTHYVDYSYNAFYYQKNIAAGIIIFLYKELNIKSQDFNLSRITLFL